MKTVMVTRRVHSRSVSASLALTGGLLLLSVAAVVAQNGWKAEQRGQAGKD